MSAGAIPLASQVGGHAGVLTSSDGSLIIKPCLAAEKTFYETVVTGNEEGFKLLRPHVPKYQGTLITEPAEGEDKGKDESCCLLLVDPFTPLPRPSRPNVDMICRACGADPVFGALSYFLISNNYSRSSSRIYLMASLNRTFSM